MSRAFSRAAVAPWLSCQRRRIRTTSSVAARHAPQDGVIRQGWTYPYEVDIGQIGVWTSFRPFGSERAGEAAKLVEQLGYGAWWVGGSPHVPDIRPVLEATSTLAAATGILNVWRNEPGETAAADAALRADFPGRLVRGI